MKHDPMTGKRYSQEYKDDAVRHWMESGKRAEDVAEDLGISTWSLRRWKTAYLKQLDGGSQSDSSQMKPSEMEAEIRRLRKELRDTQQQREILKKAVIFFGQDSERGSRS
jgi:transposase